MDHGGFNCIDCDGLQNRPLKTQKMRDSEDQEKLKKYPKTTIRVRMPDHTIVQAVFQSKERGNFGIWMGVRACWANGLLVSAVYEFVRSLLETPERKFVLCLPPRTKLVEPTITLFKAGLSPASNVLFGWIEKGEKGIAVLLTCIEPSYTKSNFSRQRFKGRISCDEAGLDSYCISSGIIIWCTYNIFI